MSRFTKAFTASEHSKNSGMGGPAKYQEVLIVDKEPRKLERVRTFGEVTVTGGVQPSNLHQQH